MLVLKPTQTRLAIEVSDLKKVFRKRDGLWALSRKSGP